MPDNVDKDGGTEETMRDELNKLKAAVEELKAQMKAQTAWVAAVLTARPPSQIDATTKPPYGLLTIVLPVVGIIAAAVIAKL
jgi:hypothetical protein